MEEDHRLPLGSASEHTALGDKVPVDFSGFRLTPIPLRTLFSSQAKLLAVYRLFHVVLLRDCGLAQPESDLPFLPHDCLTNTSFHLRSQLLLLPPENRLDDPGHVF